MLGLFVLLLTIGPKISGRFCSHPWKHSVSHANGCWASSYFCHTSYASYIFSVSWDLYCRFLRSWAPFTNNSLGQQALNTAQSPIWQQGNELYWGFFHVGLAGLSTPQFLSDLQSSTSHTVMFCSSTGIQTLLPTSSNLLVNLVQIMMGLGGLCMKDFCPLSFLSCCARICNFTKQSDYCLRIITGFLFFTRMACLLGREIAVLFTYWRTKGWLFSTCKSNASFPRVSAALCKNLRFPVFFDTITI